MIYPRFWRRDAFLFFTLIAGGLALPVFAQNAFITSLNYNLSVTPVNTATNTPGAPYTASSFSGYYAVAVNPAGTLAFVGNEPLFTFPPTITVFNAATAQFTFSFGNFGVLGLAINPTGTRLYASENQQNIVHVYDLTNAAYPEIFPAITIPGATTGLRGVAVSPDGQNLLVANLGNSTADVIGLSNGALLGRIFMPNQPRGVAYSPDGRHAYVTDFNGSTVKIIDTANYSALPAAVPFQCTNPYGVTPARDGQRIYVSCANDSYLGRSGNPGVIALDAVTGALLDQNFFSFNPSTAGDSPAGLEIHPTRTGELYVVSARQQNGIWPGLFVLNANNLSQVLATVMIQPSAHSFGQFIRPFGPTIYTLSPLPGGTQGAPYSVTLTAVGGAQPFTGWTIAAGALPAGLTFNTSTGLLSGTPTAGGDFTFTAQVTDSIGQTDTRVFTLHISLPVAITTAFLPDAELTIAYGQTLLASGGNGVYTWSAVSGFPSWLTLSASGQLTGTPSATGSLSITVRVQDGTGAFTTKLFNFTVQSPISINTASLPAGTVGSNYNQLLNSSGGTGGNVWTVDSGLTPNGVGLSAVGVLGGVPTVAGNFNFTVRVTDSAGGTATRAFTVAIVQPFMILNTLLPIGITGQQYPATQLATVGGTGAVTYQVVPAGSLPPGLSLTTGGLLSGTCGLPATQTITITATDSAAANVSGNYTLTIAARPGQPLWTRRGQFAGGLSGVALSPRYLVDSTLFIFGGGPELYRSVDGGATWTEPQPAAGPLNDRLNGVALPAAYDQTQPGAAAVLFASLDLGGVVKSVDHGASYAATNSGLPCVAGVCTVRGLAISPSFAADQTLWIATPANPAVIYRSQNAGATWGAAGQISADGYAIALYPSPNFAVDKTIFSLLPNAGIFRSLNGGVNWSQVSTVQSLALAVSPDFAADHTVLAISGAGGLLRSLDAGLNFNAIASPGYTFTDVSAQPRAGQRALWLLCSNQLQGVLVSENAGDSLVPLPDLGLPFAPVGLRLAASLPKTGGGYDLFVITQSGLYASTDSGLSFIERQNGIHAAAATGLNNAGVAGAAGLTGAWLKSADRGLNWTRLPAPGFSYVAKTVFVSPNFAADNTVFLADSALYRSTNGGQTFPTIAGAKNHYAHAFYPDYATSGKMLYADPDGLKQSLDFGASFSLLTLPAACGGPINSVAVSPHYNGTTDRTLFVSTIPAGSSGGLCKSVDGGATWTQLLYTGQPRNGTVSLPATYDEATGTGGNGTAAKTLFFSQPALRSTDGGATLVPITGTPSAGGGANMIAHPSPNFGLDSTVLFFDASQNNPGVYRSGDGGASMAATGVADALGGRRLTGLALDDGFDGRNGTNSIALAATTGSGLWRSVNGGNTFSLVTGYKFVSDRLSSLAADVATGKVYAATNDQAMFRSDDGGSTFIPFALGLPLNANIRTVYVSPVCPNNPLATINGAGLWRYTGSQWAQLTGGALSTTANYTSFLEDGTYLYTTRADGQSIRSTDCGLTWSAQSAAEINLVNQDYNPQSTPTFMSDPANKFQGPNPNWASSVTASLWGVAQSAGPRYSTTSGSSWTATPGANDYALPGGQTWSVVRALGINATSGSREVVAGTTTGLYRSIDGGATWRSVSGTGSGLEATSKNFAAAVSTTTAFGTTDLLVGASGSTNGGVYLSGDGGEHWTQVNQGFDPNNLSISSLITTSCSGCPVQYYSGSYGGGMYTRTLSVVSPPTFPATLYSCYGSISCSCATGGGSGPEQGGQAFKLCGGNFQAGAVIEFDGVPVYTNYVGGGCTLTASQIVCNAGASGTPVHAPGLASIRVRNPDTRIGYLPAQYTYTGGASRASNLLVAKSAGDAALTWSCAGCISTNPARVYRSQNALFSLYVENYNGGIGGTYTNLGAVATAQSYFWSVE